MYFYVPLSKDRGHTVLPLSVRPSVCTNLTWKLNIFPLLLNQFTYKAHIWYEGISHQYASAGTKVKVIFKGQGHLYRSRSNIKVTFLKKWPFRGHSCFTNTSFFLYKGLNRSVFKRLEAKQTLM